MTKEKFAYELIDQWLYPTSLQCMLRENYTQKDQIVTYKECVNKLSRYFDFYDQVYENADKSKFTEEQIDAILEFAILQARYDVLHKSVQEIQKEMCGRIDGSVGEIMKYLFRNSNGNRQDMDKATVLRFCRELRMAEEEYASKEAAQ